MDAPDFFQRDFDCNNLHWVAYWLNVLLMHGFITVRHLFVQLVIAMVCYLLMMRVSDWASFPALSTFASVMMYISTPREKSTISAAASACMVPGIVIGNKKWK